MESSIHAPFHMGHIEWGELTLFAGIAFMVTLLAVLLLQRPRPGPRTVSADQDVPLGSLDLPEIRLIILALPLQLLWEIAQFPLYTVWHQNDWGYIIYGLVHCTLGDLVILLILYELTALIRRDRYWYLHSAFTSGILFTVAGVAYTVYSEIHNVRIKGTWGYTDLMPIVPVLNIGGTPFLQWLLIPPILLWLMRLVYRQRVGGASPEQTK